MTIQLDIFESRKERDHGIFQAVTHADQVHDSWQERAFMFLTAFKKSTFMAEDIRKAAEGIVPDPPSQRAWGGIIVRAARAGIIERIGFSNVKNVKAHATPASVWRFK